MKFSIYLNRRVFVMELCCTYGIHVLNGRLFRDTDCNFTCIANDGYSIVDYMVASTHLFQFFTDFSFGNMDRSVHFPLFCSIRLELNTRHNNLSSDDDLEIWTKYRWNPASKSSYMVRFRNNFAQFETSLNENPLDSFISILPSFIDIIKTSAVDMLKRSRVSFQSHGSIMNVILLKELNLVHLDGIEFLTIDTI